MSAVEGQTLCAYYVGKTAVKFNIPEDEAVERLIDLIKEHHRWVDAPAPVLAG